MSRAVVTTILDGLAAVAVIAGAALVYVPAAFVVAGVALFAASWAMEPRPVKAPGGGDA